METLFVDSSSNFQPLVKLEPAFNDDELEVEIPRVRVGEIYLISMDNMAFVCSQCSAEFPLFVQFSMHVQSHLHEIDVTASVSTTKIEFDDPVTFDVAGEEPPTIELLDSVTSQEKKKKIRAENCKPSSSRAQQQPIVSNTNSIEFDPSLNIDSDHDFDRFDDGASECSNWSGHWPEDSSTKINKIATDKNKVSTNHPTGYRCFKCPTVLESLRLLHMHEKKHSRYRSYECYICHSSCQTLQQCQRHIKEHTNTVYIYKCIYCNTKFRRAKHLQFHSVQCNDTNPIKCSKCPLTFHNTLAKQLHIHSFGDNIPVNTELVVCRTCGAAYSDQDALNQHTFIHTKRLLKCEFNCDYDTYIPANYAEHVRSCARKIEVCPVCNKVFKMRNKFQTHMMRHQNIRPRQCDECGKRFTTGSALTKHMYVHVGMNNYRCDQCPRSYRRLDALTAHKRTHSGTGEHLKMCKFCPRSFVDKRSLKRHSLKVHGQPFDAEV